MSQRALVDNDAARAAAQSLLRKGLATYQEIAALCGVSRQTIRYWAVQLGAETAREDYLTKLWDDTLRKHE